MKRRDKLTAVYCRVAQLDDFAIHMQKDELARVAESQDYNGVVYYLDKGCLDKKIIRLDSHF